jgi:hypothetical protein
MRRVWWLLLACFLVLPASGAERPQQSEWFSVKLKDLELKVRLVRDPAEITALLGSDLDKEYTLAEIELIPLYNTKVTVSRDDFLLRYYANNERSTAESPEQIAGSTVLVMGKGVKIAAGNVFTQSQEPVVIGGAPGTGTRPRRIDTPGGGSLGGSAAGTTSTGATEIKQDKGAATTLIERLQELELPAGETRSVIRGYLYFQMKLKYAPKKLALNYDGTAGKCKIEFK